jgi:hypothetical protein
MMAAVGLLALPALAGATSQVTATVVRIVDHPAYDRIVVAFNGKVPLQQVELRRLTTTMATVRVDHPGLTTGQISTIHADGLSVALQPATQALQLAIGFTARKFKYVGYSQLPRNRLAIDVWKSTPPLNPGHTCSGLTLGTVAVSAGVATVTGTEHGVFENQFGVVVRGASGTVLGRKAAVHGPGGWTAKVHYMAAQGQTGTIEAVSFSAKDGSLECIAQTSATLPAS